MAKLTNIFSNFSSAIVKALVPSFSGMLRVKAARPMVNWILQSILLLKGSIANSDVKVSVYFVRYLYTLSRKSGLVFTVKYLKASTSLLMQAIAGEAHASTQCLGAAVSRTNSGLPRIIPAVHRMKIRAGDIRTIRLWLTLFSIYRVLDYTGKLSIKTIISPSNASINHKEIRDVVSAFMRDFNLSLIDTRPDSLMAKPFWITTTSPNSTKSPLQAGGPKTASTSIYSLLGSWVALDRTKTFKILKEFCHAFGIGGDLINVFSSSRFASRYTPPSLWDMASPGKSNEIPLSTTYLGKLGYKVEPAGKIRVFAMVDAFTQWLLAPFHRALFALLEVLPQDATHDQNQTVLDFIERCKSENVKLIYSFDLTAATDRLPIAAQSLIVDCVTGRSIGSIWASALIDRWYQLPPNTWGDTDQRSLEFLKLDESNPFIQIGDRLDKKTGKYFKYVKAVRYAVGQPMGALSSWAMLALTHHIMVAIAASRVDKPAFSRYLVLGDDIVIADKAVAMSYLNVAKEWDIEINLSKSVISTNGSFEFAKRFIYKFQDVSGLSFKEMAVARHDLRGLFQLFDRVSRFRETRVSELLSFLGFGYRSLSRMTTKYKKLGNRMARALYLLSYPNERFSTLTSIEDWLMSPSFNKAGLVNFPEKGLSYLKELCLSQAENLKEGNLPRTPEEYTHYMMKLFWNGDPSPSPKDYAEGTNLALYDFTLLSLRFILNELYSDLFFDYESTLIELQDTFDCTEDEDLDVETLWTQLEELENIRSRHTKVSEYTTLTDVISLNKSKLLKRAYTIRSHIQSLSSSVKL